MGCPGPGAPGGVVSEEMSSVVEELINLVRRWFVYSDFSSQRRRALVDRIRAGGPGLIASSTIQNWKTTTNHLIAFLHRRDITLPLDRWEVGAFGVFLARERSMGVESFVQHISRLNRMHDYMGLPPPSPKLADPRRQFERLRKVFTIPQSELTRAPFYVRHCLFALREFHRANKLPTSQRFVVQRRCILLLCLVLLFGRSQLLKRLCVGHFVLSETHLTIREFDFKGKEQHGFTADCPLPSATGLLSREMDPYIAIGEYVAFVRGLGGSLVFWGLDSTVESYKATNMKGWSGICTYQCRTLLSGFTPPEGLYFSSHSGRILGLSLALHPEVRCDLDFALAWGSWSRAAGAWKTYCHQLSLGEEEVLWAKLVFAHLCPGFGPTLQYQRLTIKKKK